VGLKVVGEDSGVGGESSRTKTTNHDKESRANPSLGVFRKEKEEETPNG